jgi:hypothetical protein
VPRLQQFSDNSHTTTAFPRRLNCTLNFSQPLKMAVCSQTELLSKSQRQNQSLLRPTACRPVCVGVTGPSWTRDKFLFLEIILRQLRDCWCGGPTLTKGWVCSLYLPLGLASALVLGFESRGTHDIILLSQIRDSSNLEGHVPI